MRQKRNVAVILGVLLFVGGCGYGYYLGLHGPSVRNFPDIHEGIEEDADCLSCHDPKSGNDEAPATTHPSFSGCIGCHNDDPS